MDSDKKKLNKRQIDFLSFYLDPKSGTFSDCKKSALRAGFRMQYAENLTNAMPLWLSEVMEREKRMVNKAEKNLEAHLDLNIREKGINPQVLGIKHRASEFVAERLGKKKWSQKNETEHSGEVVMKWEE